MDIATDKLNVKEYEDPFEHGNDRLQMDTSDQTYLCYVLVIRKEWKRYEKTMDGSCISGVCMCMYGQCNGWQGIPFSIKTRAG